MEGQITIDCPWLAVHSASMFIWMCCVNFQQHPLLSSVSQWLINSSYHGKISSFLFMMSVANLSGTDVQGFISMHGDSQRSSECQGHICSGTRLDYVGLSAGATLRKNTKEKMILDLGLNKKLF